jgi:hypothetical protein
MSRHLLVPLLMLVSTALQAQQPPVKDQPLPDSTYLRITLELPSYASFALARSQALRNGDITQYVHQRVTHLDLQKCVLQWRYTRMVEDGRRIGTRSYLQKTIPLKEIDLKHIDVRPAIGPVGFRSDIDHWEIVFHAAQRNRRPFEIRNLEGGEIRRAERMMALELTGQENARLFADLLRDAALRCDTWNTAPLRPIR